jgi:hypothetical protein
MNHSLRFMRLATGMAESQMAEEAARLVGVQAGRDMATSGTWW